MFDAENAADVAGAFYIARGSGLIRPAPQDGRRGLPN